MKKWFRLFAVAGVALLTLAITLVVLANVLITPERIKATLIPLVEKNLNRKVELGEIEVSLFSGISIDGLKIYEQDEDELFLSADLVRLKYQLLPLLAMKVVVDEVRLEKPSIRLVRFKEGGFNFDDLTRGAAQQDETATAKAEAIPGDAVSSPISLLISQVLLQDGQLVFYDHLLNQVAPYRYEISSLQVDAKGVTLSGDVPLSLQCQVNGGELALDGRMRLQPFGGDFEVSLQNLDLVAFKPYFQEAIPGKLGSVKLNLKTRISGDQEKLALKGTLSLIDLDLILDALPDAMIEKASLSTTYDLQFDRKADQLQIRQFDLDYNGARINSKGEVLKLTDEPSLDLTVATTDMQIRQAINAAPKGLLGDIISFDPAGKLSFEAKLAGRIDDAVKLLKSANIDLENVQATVSGHRPALSGRLRLNGEQLGSENLQLRMGDNRANISLNASRIISGPIVVNADLVSERFLLEPVLQGGAGSAVSLDQSSEKAVAVKDEEPGPFDIPLQAGGTIKIAETVWKGVAVQDFLAHYQLKNNILILDKIDGRVAGGSFSNSARVDLGKKGLAYSARIAVKTVQADPLLTAFLPEAAGSLLGAMDLNLEIDGRGTIWQTLSRNLSGSGGMQLANGRLVSPTLTNGLGSILQLPNLKDIQFNNFTGQFTVDKGKVKLDGQMLGSQLKLFPKGTVGLDGSLNLALDTRLSPELSARLDKKGGVTKYLADKEGWSQMPLLLTGSFSSPSFGLDPKGVREQATRAIGNELGRQLDKLMKKPSSTSQEPAAESLQDDADPAKKLLQDSLKNLFGN